MCSRCWAMRVSPDAAALANEAPVIEEVADVALVLPVLRVAGEELAMGTLRPGGAM